MMRNLTILGNLIAVLLLTLSSLPAWAQVPNLLEYDGYLLEGGKAVTGNRTIGVRLYNASTNGSLLYSETIGTVNVTNGQFYFQYGQNGMAGNSTTPTGIGSVLTGSQNWLAITINNTEQTPRERLLSVPFALRSADAQKTDADFRKIVDAVGKVIVAFGGNASTLLSNPASTISSIEQGAKDLLEIRKRANPIPISGGNLTAEPNRSYLAPATGVSTITLPINAQIGDSVRVLGSGVCVQAPRGAAIVNKWCPLKISLQGVGVLTNDSGSNGSAILCDDKAEILYSFGRNSTASPENEYLVISKDGGTTWNSLGHFSSLEFELRGCSSDGSRLLYTQNHPENAIKLFTNYGNQTKTLSIPNSNVSRNMVCFMARQGGRIFAFTRNQSSNLVQLNTTSNDGVAWTTANLTFAPNLDLTIGTKFSISGNGSVCALVITESPINTQSLYLSENSGVNWKKILLPNFISNANSPDQIKNALVSEDGNTLLVFAQKRNYQDIIYVSNNRGATWNENIPTGSPSINTNDLRLSEGKLRSVPSLKKVYINIMSEGLAFTKDYGLTWNRWRGPLQSQTGASTDGSLDCISADGYRMVASGSGGYKSWTDKLYSAGSSEFIYVGSGNWVANYFEPETM